MLFLVIFLVVGWPMTEVGGCCPDTWVAFGGSCYYFGETLQLDWTQGTHHCSNYTSKLATIQTNEEMSFLKSFAKRLKTTARYNFFWIGGNDKAVKGTYVWYTDNSHVNNTVVTWHPGEPSDSAAEHCMLLWDIFDYNVGNYMCGSKGHVICEKGYV